MTGKKHLSAKDNQDKSILYEGKAKKLYSTDDPSIILVEYKDAATAFNGVKKDTITGKGKLNNRISSLIFKWLADRGVSSHFIKQVDDVCQLVKNVEIFPLEVVVRNTAAGSLVKRLGLTEGKKLDQPLVEFYYKNDALGDPLINSGHIALLKIANRSQIVTITDLALEINSYLVELIAKCQADLIDIKLEFGKLDDGTIILADEISPDTCRIWDDATGKSLDKDVYRKDLGDLIEVYQTMLDRLETVID